MNSRISCEEFTKIYKIELHFIKNLNLNGLIVLQHDNGTDYIDYDNIPLVEKFARWHYDMDINMEGIEVISRLLDKISSIQQENLSMRNELQYFRQNFFIDEEY